MRLKRQVRLAFYFSFFVRLIHREMHLDMGGPLVSLELCVFASISRKAITQWNFVSHSLAEQQLIHRRKNHKES